MKKQKCPKNVCPKCVAKKDSTKGYACESVDAFSKLSDSELADLLKAGEQATRHRKKDKTKPLIEATKDMSIKDIMEALMEDISLRQPNKQDIIVKLGPFEADRFGYQFNVIVKQQPQ